VEDNTPENYNVRLYMTREGYFKKITLQSLRGNDEQRLKENDEILFEEDTDNLSDLIFVTDRCQLYRARTADFDCVKASSMGEFLAAKLGMDEGEKPIFMRVQKGYPQGENFVFIFKNGKGVRVPVNQYETKGNRRKLVGAYSSASPICGVFYEVEKNPFEIMLISNADRAIILKTSLIPIKATRTSGGVTLMTMKKGQELTLALSKFSEKYDTSKGYRKLKIPATGQLLADEDLSAHQLKIET
jgi:DNA gyrase subunit A